MLKNREKYNIIVKGGSEIMGKMKYKYNMKKIIICGMLLLIIMCIPKNIFGAVIELTENPEMDDIINELYSWYMNHPSATESELAQQIDNICGGDVEKMKKLQHTYTYNGIGIWNGGNSDSIYYRATNIVLEAKKDNSQIPTGGNQDDQAKMLKELSDMSSIAYDQNASLEDLKRLEAKLKEYKDKYGISDYMLKDIAQKVKEKLNAKGETGSTVADEISEREEEREEYEGEYSGGTTPGLLGNPTVSTSHTLAEIIKEARRIFRKRYWKIEF